MNYVKLHINKLQVFIKFVVEPLFLSKIVLINRNSHVVSNQNANYKG